MSCRRRKKWIVTPHQPDRYHTAPRRRSAGGLVVGERSKYPAGLFGARLTNGNVHLEQANCPNDFLWLVHLIKDVSFPLRRPGQDIVCLEVRWKSGGKEELCYNCTRS